jgi:hypothetical protein
MPAVGPAETCVPSGMSALRQKPATLQVPLCLGEAVLEFACRARPTGQISSLIRFSARAVCPARKPKIYIIRFFGNYDLLFPFRSGTRGVRVVTNVERNAMDGLMPKDVRHRRGRRSRVVLARPCRRQIGDDANASRRRRWQTLVHRGEHAISRKPLRTEGRSDHRLCLWFTRSRKFLLRGSPGCSGHPAFPAPTAFRGTRFDGITRT